MICRVAGEDLKVVSFAHFKRTCLALYQRENTDIKDSALVYGCRRCETGAAILQGTLKDLPANIGLINLEEGKKMEKKTATSVAIVLPGWIKSGILADPKILTMTTTDLKPYSKLPIPAAKTSGPCLNCSRSERINACGLCSKCYFAALGKQGPALFEALFDMEEMLKKKPATVAEPEAVTTKEPESRFSHGSGSTTAVDLPAKQPAPNEMIHDLEMELCERNTIIGAAIDVLLADGEEIDDLAVLAHRRIAEIEELRRRDGKKEAVVADGYLPLSGVLVQALDQAQYGKGRDRHANGLPFLQQPIMIETRSVGLGFPAGQARKKILEAINCCESHPDRAIADLLGAINYTAAAILGIQERRQTNTDLPQGAANA